MSDVRAVVAGIILTAVLCGVGSACSSPSAYDKLTSDMKTLCAKANDPTSVVAAVPAGTVVVELQVAHMSTKPWDTLPPSDLIVECGNGQPGSGTILLDECGRRTPAPPPPMTVACPAGSACSPLAAQLVAPFQIAGC